MNCNEAKKNVTNLEEIYSFFSPADKPNGFAGSSISVNELVISN